ncbi:MAG: substrate-binding domain-containing protein [Atopostipes sp.]|nr:substrate-binding domain-containing protein [Tetragenococcus koreensis]MDN6161980.1 substrate-binding domain-containing protein [Atopostipes sp.]
MVVFDTDANLVDFNVYEELNIPTVFVDKEVKGFTSVYSDNYKGAKIATEHLLELDHKKIAYIHGEGNGFVEKERYAGFEDTMITNEMEIPEEYIQSGGYYSSDGGRRAMMKLLRLENPPTAVFVVGDEMAIGAIQAIKESGLKVPEDISIIGFDDIRLASYSEPPLTTIRQDKEKIGQTVALLIIESILNFGSLPTSNVVPVHLIKRETTNKLV